MENKLDDQAPDPGMLWLAIGIGVFSVLASFVLAIYCSAAGQASVGRASAGQASAAETSAAPQPIEAPTKVLIQGEDAG